MLFAPPPAAAPAALFCWTFPCFSKPARIAAWTGRSPSPRRAASRIARIRRRGALRPAQIAAIIAKQMPDAEKRRRADHVIRTGLSRFETRRQVERLIGQLK